jgi:membrane-bound metal-dependent hydrolase YbcI (DUF457 family)
VAGGVLVDIDFLLLPFPFFNAVHRVATHNLLFVAVLAVIGFFVARVRPWVVALSVALGGLLHLFLDSILDDNPSNGIGVALFWPFSQRVVSPFNLIPPEPNAVGWTDLGHVLQGLGRDLLLELPFIVLAGVLLLVQTGRKLRVEYKEG